jgi:arylamine N-acetyltransferase
MTAFDLETYLQRIDYVGSRTPSLHALEAITTAHLRSVPFENFDIHLGRPLRCIREFVPMCRHHQTSSASWFTQARICVILTGQGRSALIEDVLQETGAPPRSDLLPGERLEILRERFGVDLPRFPENKSKHWRMRTRAFANRWQSRLRKLRQAW